MTLLFVDNRDSFTYNLVQAFDILGAPVRVRASQEICREEVNSIEAEWLVIGPGPGSPAAVGVCGDLIRRFAGTVPVLGVCLGHQCLAEAYGGCVVRAKHPRHGKTSQIHHEGQGVFAGLPKPFEATRYHSLVVDPESLPSRLEVTATADDGTVMGIRDRMTGAEGVQFHPESVLTSEGMQLLENFLCLDSFEKVETA